MNERTDQTLWWAECDDCEFSTADDKSFAERHAQADADQHEEAEVYEHEVQIKCSINGVVQR
jgi:hypothetical protein